MLTTILLIAGLVCFIIEAVHWPKAPFSFGWIGLACWILTLLIK
jgi:hypothetical protein